MTEEKFQKELKEIQLKNEEIEYKNRLKDEKNKYKRKFKLPSTSKLVLIFVFILCIQILIFCEYVMITTGDTSALYVLIGVPVSLIPVVMSYYHKSKAENTVGGITYDTAMLQLENSYYDEVMYTDSEDAQG